MAQEDDSPGLRIRIVFGERGIDRARQGRVAGADRFRRSIAAAGRAMGMSYKRAWMLIETMNAMFREPVVESTRGGAQGGGARLTDTGHKVAAAYRAFETEAARQRRGASCGITGVARRYFRQEIALDLRPGSSICLGVHIKGERCFAGFAAAPQLPFFAATFFIAAPARADDLVVFAAASLTNALEAVAARWMDETGSRVVISFAGLLRPSRARSRRARRRISSFSANTDWMDALAAAGELREGARRAILGNSLVLIAHGGDVSPVTIDENLDLVGMLDGGRLSMALVDAVPAGMYGREGADHARSVGCRRAACGAIGQMSARRSPSSRWGRRLWESSMHQMPGWRIA